VCVFLFLKGVPEEQCAVCESPCAGVLCVLLNLLLGTVVVTRHTHAPWSSTLRVQPPFMSCCSRFQLPHKLSLLHLCKRDQASSVFTFFVSSVTQSSCSSSTACFTYTQTLSLWYYY
jgi:hypothetical protein